MTFSLTETLFFITGLVAVLCLLAMMNTKERRRAAFSFSPNPDEITYHDDILVFEDGQLIDANDEIEDTTLGEFLTDYETRFPDLAKTLAQEGPIDAMILSGTDGTSHAEISRAGAITRITLHTTAGPPPGPGNDTPAASVDHALEVAPLAVWSTDETGEVSYGNAAYRSLAATATHPMLFDKPSLEGLEPGVLQRIALPATQNQSSAWFDVSNEHCAGGNTIYYATNVDATVAAEAAQRKFVQTLTKTFAQLSTGLAIFDRKRQLALFNPALIDLTLLPTEVLSGRPTIETFFDQLRDRQMMPEPRNYRSWRDQLSDIMSKAENGVYCEIWSLPSGLTYRISGKPHPDGAVAFLFEDISAEISLTRRFRAELEVSQSALEAIDSAIAVFSRSGSLTFTNGRFRDMWKCDPDESFIEMSVSDTSKIWREQGKPSPIWVELRDFVVAIEDRAAWSGHVVHVSEGPLRVDAAPLPGGTTLIQFTKVPAPEHPAAPRVEAYTTQEG